MDSKQTMDDFNKSQTIESKIHEACMNGETEQFLNLINEAEHLDIVEIDKKRTLIFQQEIVYYFLRPPYRQYGLILKYNFILYVIIFKNMC